MASSAARNNYAFAWRGEIMKQLPGLGIGYNRANRHQNIAVFAIAPVALVAFAVRASACAKLWVEAELKEGI